MGMGKRREACVAYKAPPSMSKERSSIEEEAKRRYETFRFGFKISFTSTIHHLTYLAVFSLSL